MAPTPAAPQPPPRAERPLTGSDVDRIAAILRLEDERRADTVALGMHLADPNPEIRRRAALALGRIGDPGAAPLLLRALTDTAALVRREAAFALGELGAASELVVSHLAERTRLDEPDVAAEAAAALGKLPGEPSFAALAALLAEARPGTGAIPDPVIGEALLAVWHMPQPERALPVIAPLVWPAEAGIRWRATYAVMRIGRPASVAVLLPSLSDSDPLIRSTAARGLRQPVADSAGQAEEVRAALLAALRDHHPHVRINAVNALAGFRDAAVADSVANLLADADGNVRVAAAQALAGMDAATHAPALLGLVSDTTAATGLRAAALNSLVRLDPVLGGRAAAEWATSSRWLLRWLAVRAVGSPDWGTAGPALDILARDPHPLVASAALGAASRARDTSTAARALLLEGLRRPELEVRAAAIRGLARSAGPEDMAPLLEAYDRAQRDTGNAAALAAIDGLGALRQAGVPVENVFFARFAPPRDVTLRRRVAARLGGDWPMVDESAPAPRPDSFYRNVVERLVEPAYRGEPAPQLVIRVREGEIVVELAPADAPLTVMNLIELVESGYFAAEGDADRRRWHRVVPNFVLQDGDPRGDGGGGPGYAIRDEINRLRYERGMLGMALSGPDTGGSQFFITHSPQPHLDGGYTIFGRVVAGMDIADRVVQEEPILEMRIIWP